jgi:hypothetical protein
MQSERMYGGISACACRGDAADAAQECSAALALSIANTFPADCVIVAKYHL